MFKKLVAIVFVFTIAACSSSHTVIPPKDALALQEMQTREFEASMTMTYASVLSVLQDVGYIVESADANSGLITAKSPTASKTSYSLLWGFGKNNESTRVTAFVEPIGSEVSKVRLNFVHIKGKSQAYGMNSQIDTPVEDPTVYTDVFEKIDETIFVKISLQ